MAAVWELEKLLGVAQARTESLNWTRPMLSMEEQLTLVLVLELAFGVIFELPLVMAVLGLVGLVSSKFLFKYQRHAFVVCLIVAAIITPTGDAVNLALMAGPDAALLRAGRAAGVAGREAPRPHHPGRPRGRGAVMTAFAQPLQARLARRLRYSKAVAWRFRFTIALVVVWFGLLPLVYVARYPGGITFGKALHHVYFLLFGQPSLDYVEDWLLELLNLAHPPAGPGDGGGRRGAVLVPLQRAQARRPGVDRSAR